MAATPGRYACDCFEVICLHFVPLIMACQGSLRLDDTPVPILVDKGHLVLLGGVPVDGGDGMVGGPSLFGDELSRGHVPDQDVAPAGPGHQVAAVA